MLARTNIGQALGPQLSNCQSFARVQHVKNETPGFPGAIPIRCRFTLGMIGSVIRIGSPKNLRSPSAANRSVASIEMPHGSRMFPHVFLPTRIQMDRHL